MKYKFWIIGVFILVLCTILHTGHIREERYARACDDSNGQDIVDELFKRAGFNWTRTDISAWAAVDLGNISAEDLEGILTDAGSYLNMDIEPNNTLKYCEETGRINLQGNGKNGLKYDIIIAGGRNTHIVINVENYGHLSDSRTLMDQLEEYFHSIKASPHITASFTGDIQGKLSTDERSALARDLIRGIKGTAIQIMEDDQLVSIAGYSPMIDTTPMDGINFQIASRYNEFMDKTYLWIGTPLISTEY
ncbi:MAG: YwmB family TATA-box binding protein [Caldicoprobacterales bacterium]